MDGCYGFRISSSIPLRFAREGADDGWPVLEVVEGGDPPAELQPPVLAWTAAGAQPVSAQVHRVSDGGLAVHVDGGGWFGVDVDAARVSVPRAGEPVRREERLWGLPALLCFLGRGDLPLHAAALEVDGRAVLFGGPSRAGKTTLAAFAAAAGHRLLSEDLSCIRLDPSPHVFPGPATLRVRRDMAGVVDLPASTKYDVGDDRVHLSLDPRLRGTAASVQLAGIVLLHAGDELALQPCPPETALRDLWALTFRLPEPGPRAACFDRLVRLVEAVPVHRLARPLDLASLPAALAALEEVARA